MWFKNRRAKWRKQKREQQEVAKRAALSAVIKSSPDATGQLDEYAADEESDQGTDDQCLSDDPENNNGALDSHAPKPGVLGDRGPLSSFGGIGRGLDAVKVYGLPHSTTPEH